MSDEDRSVDHEHSTGGLSRRAFLGGVGVSALGLLLPELGVPTRVGARSSLTSVEAARAPYRLAMHVHSSFSEGVGSMYAALAEARRTNHDLVFFTDHDGRKKGEIARRGVHFKGPSEFEDPIGTWVWRNRTEGAVSSRSQQWVANPSSPVEPGHALAVSVTSSPTGAAFNGFDGDDGGSTKGFRANVSGLRIFIDVRNEQPSADAWLELRLYLSYYPGLAGFGAGYRSLVYRIGTQTGRSRDVANPLRGIVRIAVTRAAWTTLELRPLEDIAAIFTELPAPADMHVTGMAAGNNVVLTVGAQSRNGATARGQFDRLRLVRTTVGTAAYNLQRQILQQYGPLFPSLQLRTGDEIGHANPHLMWLTGSPAPIAYPYRNWPNSADVRKVIDTVHAGGGVLQYNHPFGAEAKGAFTDPTALVKQARALLKSTGAWPLIDLLEVGYEIRGKGTDMASLATHLRLLDLMARAGRFVTATGVNDDHEGLVQSWSTRNNRFSTGIWASSLDDAGVREALLRGQAWGVELEANNTVAHLDMSVDDVVPMGSVSINQRSTRTVQITCPTVPPGGRAELLRGPVDYIDTDLTNKTVVVATATEAQLKGGVVGRAVNTSTNCFVRVQIRNGANRIVAFSNPIWLLRGEPPGGIPPRRRAP